VKIIIGNNIMKKAEAELYLYNEWECGNLPSNFTTDHSEYQEALKFTIKNGYYYLYAEQQNQWT